MSKGAALIIAIGLVILGMYLGEGLTNIGKGLSNLGEYLGKNKKEKQL